jgi:hypothetical protein
MPLWHCSSTYLYIFNSLYIDLCVLGICYEGVRYYCTVGARNTSISLHNNICSTCVCDQYNLIWFGGLYWAIVLSPGLKLSFEVKFGISVSSSSHCLYFFKDVNMINTSQIFELSYFININILDLLMFSFDNLSMKYKAFEASKWFIEK